MKIRFIVPLSFLVLLQGVSSSNVFSRTFNELHDDPGPQTASRVWVPTKWIDQRLDHFDDDETRTWQMVRISEYNS